MKTHTDSISPRRRTNQHRTNQHRTNQHRTNQHRTECFWRSSRAIHFFCFILCGLLSSGCGVIREKKTSEADPAIVQATQKPLSPDAAKSVFSEMGENWLYGPGLGQTALNVGAMVVFPPYAIYVLGNSVLSMSGYEPLYVTDLLPEGERDEVNMMYDEVTTAPGRVSAALAGKEFRSKEVASERMKAIVAEGAAAPESEKPRGG